MVSCSIGRVMLVLYLFLLFTCAVFTVADAQGLPQLPNQSNPSNDCGCPRGDDAIPVSSGMLTPFLPKIPNLELGFLYSFGNNVRTGRFTADYLLPFRLSADSVLFGEAHAEGWDFWKKPSVSMTAPEGFTTTTSTTNNRVDLSFGGGYRTMLGGGTLLGVNGFYDTSRLFNKWYPSGGVGLEMAANIAGDDAIDLNFNWYGNLFNRDVLVNAFRNKGNSFDVEAGYSHSLFNQALDLRLKVIGYQFDIGTAVRGWRGGADLTTRNGVFTLRYEHGRDRLNGDYNTVGGFVTVGFRLENMLSGASPFTLPEPVFRSPRDLRRLLGLKVKRNWHQPAAVVAARNVTNPSNPPGPPPSNPCPNLNGAIFLVSSVLNGEVFGPSALLQDPSGNMGDIYDVTFCWCGLTNWNAPHETIMVVLQLNSSIACPTSFTPDGPSGCLTRNSWADAPALPVPGTVELYNNFIPPTTFPLIFAKGGGFSLSLKKR
jgi:hypothetical protein